MFRWLVAGFPSGTEDSRIMPPSPRSSLGARTALFLAAGACSSSLALSAPSLAAEAPLAPLRPFVERVLTEHPRAAMTHAAVARARADAEVLAQPLYNPEIGYAGERTRTPAGADAAGGSAMTNLAELSLTTDFGVKQASRREIGARGIDAASAQAAEDRLGLAAEAMAALARFQGAQARDRLASRQEEAMGAFLSLAEKLRKAGDSSAADLALARIALAETRKLRNETRVALVRAREEVRGLCACAPDEVPRLPDPPPPDSLLGEAPAALDALPAVRTARALVETARADLRLAGDERVPDPTFRLGGGRDGAATKITFGVSIPLPVLNSGSARVGSAGRALVAAEVAEQAARRAAQTELAVSRAAAVETWSGWQAWQTQGAPPAEQQMTLLQRLWVGGEISATDYFVQLRETVRVAQQGADLWAETWSALAEGLRTANRIDSALGL